MQFERYFLKLFELPDYSIYQIGISQNSDQDTVVQKRQNKEKPHAASACKSIAR